MPEQPVPPNPPVTKNPFRALDEEERVYAPQQVPGGVSVPEEVDEGGSAGAGTATAAADNLTDVTAADRAVPDALDRDRPAVDAGGTKSDTTGDDQIGVDRPPKRDVRAGNR
jgi:hypothetical protein